MTAMTGFVGQTMSGNHNKRDRHEWRVWGGVDLEDQPVVSQIYEITPRPLACFLHKIIAACILCAGITKQV